MTFEQWRYVFTNTFSEEEARRLYERYHIPASGRVFWAAPANIHPGPDDMHANYENPNRAPLLFISGGEDHRMPPSIQRSNAKHYKAEGTITEVVEYEGRAHLMPSQTGWEEIADYALSWATEQRPCGRHDLRGQRARDWSDGTRTRDLRHDSCAARVAVLRGYSPMTALAGSSAPANRR